MVSCKKNGKKAMNGKLGKMQRETLRTTVLEFASKASGKS
jgi:hypothetical protein